MSVFKNYDLSSLTPKQRERVEDAIERKKKKKVFPPLIAFLWFIVITYGIPVVMVLKLIQYQMSDRLFDYLISIHWVWYIVLTLFYILFMIFKDVMNPLTEEVGDTFLGDTFLEYPEIYGYASWVGSIKQTLNHLFMIGKSILWFALGRFWLGIFAAVSYIIICSLLAVIKEKAMELLEEVENTPTDTFEIEDGEPTQ